MGYKEMAMDAGYTGDEADSVARQLEDDDQAEHEREQMQLYQAEQECMERHTQLLLNDWPQLQMDIANWSTAQFPHQTPHSKIEHLRSELTELDEDPNDITEFADCFMLLIDTARMVGYDMSEIYNAVKAKLEINKGRTWGEPDEHGVCYHIKDET